ncbi:MAG: hypothetical protein RLZZ127_1670 [Planctomycetota bacterium]
MIRACVAAASALALAGCAPERPAPAAAAASPDRPAAVAPLLPAAWAGIWRSEGGGVLALGDDRLLWTGGDGGIEEWRPRAVRSIGPALVLDLADGPAALTPGRAVRERQVAGQALWAELEVLDLHRAGRPPQRLWRDGGTAWLPAAAPAPAPMALAPADPDGLWRARLRGFADPVWGDAGEELLAAAVAGAPRPQLAARIDAVGRRERLAALDRLEASLADPTLRPAADRRLADAEAWLAAAGVWLASRP